MSKLSITLTRRKHGETILQDTHTSGNRAVTEKVDRQDLFANERIRAERNEERYPNNFVS